MIPNPLICWWVVCISRFLLWKSYWNSGYLWHLHPALWKLMVRLLLEVTDCCFGDFLTSAAFLLLFLFVFQDNINSCIGHAQCLCSGSDGFVLLSQLFSHRRLSGVHICSSILTTKAAFKVKKKKTNSDLWSRVNRNIFSLLRKQKNWPGCSSTFGW